AAEFDRVVATNVRPVVVKLVDRPLRTGRVRPAIHVSEKIQASYGRNLVLNLFRRVEDVRVVDTVDAPLETAAARVHENEDLIAAARHQGFADPVRRQRPRPADGKRLIRTINDLRSAVKVAAESAHVNEVVDRQTALDLMFITRQIVNVDVFLALIGFRRTALEEVR